MAIRHLLGHHILLEFVSKKTGGASSMAIRSRATSSYRLVSLCELAALLLLFTSVAPSFAAASGPDLRWYPSASEDVAGYVVYVGSESGFYQARNVDFAVDIGQNFTLEDGIAHHPLSNLISKSSWIVMTAYNSTGDESSASNEIFATPPKTCVRDADCDDGDLCNGREICSDSTCAAGAPLVCAAARQCTIGSCDAVMGCIVDPVPDGTTCDDEDPSTFADICTAGLCSGSQFPPDPPDAFYLELFESYDSGQNPDGWLDTGARNSMAEADLFHVFAMSDGNRVFRTTSTATNIHSHLVAGESEGWSDYEYSGRMRIDSARGGVGVTLYSDYPNSDEYYRLRRYGSGSFHLAPHPDAHGTCAGSTDTRVVPSANTWYFFRFRAFSEPDGTRVQAKVWAEGTGEPVHWQVDCLDPVTGAFEGGAPGVWAMGSGSRYWDDLAVAPVAGEGMPEAECAMNADCSDGDTCNGGEICVGGSCEPGEALRCQDSDACNVVYCDISLGCVVEQVPNGEPCDDGDLCTTQDVCLAGVCTGGRDLVCAAPGVCQAGLCDPGYGCVVEDVPDGTTCDDGDSGTVDDVCHLGICRGVAGGSSEPPIGPGPGFNLFFQDFELYPFGADPQGWLDTAALNSLNEDPDLFEIFEFSDGNRVFGTMSSATNIHSHYVADASVYWSQYEFRGRLRIESSSGGIGVTLYSDYPNSDSYYRLRRYGSGTFHLASHPDGQISCDGATTTQVRPAAHTWYEFRFQAFSETNGMRIRAKVWAETEGEPGLWQVDCLASGDDAFVAGSPGVWSMGSGAKYWDDLEAVALTDEAPEILEEFEDDAFYFEDFESYRYGSDVDGWFDTAPKNSLAEDQELFSVLELFDGNHVLATSSTATNIHSHFVGDDSDRWNAYELSGRMQITKSGGGIGVTVYSDYPDSDSYYRLRRYGGRTFHLAPHPDGQQTCRGTTDTGVKPVKNVWYRFRFQAFAEEGGTRLRAMVWSETQSAPRDWQVDCVTVGFEAFDSGRPGVWSMGRGLKLWDDLRAGPIEK